MTVIVGLPLLALAAGVQGAVLAQYPLFGGTPDLVLLLVLSWTLVGELQGGVVWGLLGGLCLDLLSAGPLGAAVLGLMLATFLAGLTEGRFWRSHVLLPLAVVLGGTLVYHLTLLLVLSATGHGVPWGVALVQITLPAMLLNTLLMLPVYTLVRGLHAFVKPAPVTI